jgi:hypothetical protein
VASDQSQLQTVSDGAEDQMVPSNKDNENHKDVGNIPSV